MDAKIVIWKGEIKHGERKKKQEEEEEVLEMENRTLQLLCKRFFFFVKDLQCKLSKSFFYSFEILPG